MASPRQRLFWRKCRWHLRWLRRLALALFFLLLVTVFYSNRVGVPGFIKNTVLERLRARGLDLQIQRLRLRRSGLVAEEVRFGRTNDSATLQLTARRVNVGLAYARLLRGQLQVDSLELRDGALQWFSEATNLPPRTLAVTNIQAHVSLLPDDQWTLDNFQAQFADANVQLTAYLTNASALRDWPIFLARKPVPPGTIQKRLRYLAETFEQIHFSASPTLVFDLRGDARNPQSFTGVLMLNAPGAETPWAQVTEGHLYVRLAEPKSPGRSRAQVRLVAATAQTRWATARNFQMSVRMLSTDSDNQVQGRILASTREVATAWATTTNVEFSAQWTHSLTNPIPLAGTALLRSGEMQTRWGTAGNVHFVARLSPPETNAIPAVGDDWGGWAYLAESFLDFEGQFADVKTPKLNTDQIILTGQWRPPQMTIDHLDAKLESGEFHGQIGLDVVSRELTFETKSHFDLLKISPIVTEKTREWLSQFSWEQIPSLTMNGSLILPAWNNRHPDWRAEVRPTVRLNGHFQVNDGAFRGVQSSYAESHFTYSNMVWRLPDLHVVRPEGDLDLVHEGDDRTKDYYWHIHSRIDLHALRPLFATNQTRAFDLVTFETPPVIDGELRGRWHDHSRIGAQLQVAATNFTFRNQMVGSAQATVEYTNLVLKIIEPRAERGMQHGSADLVMIDFKSQRIFLTNGFSTADPQVIASMLGPKTAKTVEPYHFVTPPVGRVNGVIPIHDDGTQDLTFELDGGPFQWWKFNLPHISGRVHWWGDQLALDDIQAEFYNGAMAGGVEFNFAALEGADFHLDCTITNTSLHLLLQDLSTRTNHLEGTVSGRLTVTHANTKDWLSWQGKGRAELRDGLLWEIPIFGIFSPILDTIAPGIGSSRFSNGSARFVITNSVIQTDDLELRSPYMRLQYHGAVDFKGKLNARVEAELLRDAWVVGRLVSLVLWPVSKVFEYQVTGFLHEPKMEPLYVPKFLLMPLHPIKSIKEMMPDSSVGPTNAPPQ